MPSPVPPIVGQHAESSAMSALLQPPGSIIELCHVVRDMDHAIRHWTMLGAGPWFVGELELSENQFHRGQPTEMSIEVAFGFSGGLLIELVRPIKDIPSVFREVLDTRGPGYHHVMLRADFDEGCARLHAAGHEIAMRGTMPSGERCVLFDTRGDNDGFIELMEISPLIERQMENMARAHREWDGHSDPRRPLASSFT